MLGSFSGIFMFLLAVLFFCAVGALLWWAFTRLFAVIPLPEPVKTIVYVLCVLIVGLFLLAVAYNMFFAGGLAAFGSHSHCDALHSC